MKVVEVVPIHLRALCPGEGNHVQNIRESHPEGEETRLVLDMIEEGITEIEEIVGTVGTAGIGDTGITGITGTEDGMILGEEKKEGLELFWEIARNFDTKRAVERLAGKWDESNIEQITIEPGESAPYLYGREGTTLRKIAFASQCDILMAEEGKDICIAGEPENRDAAKHYIKALSMQREGKIRYNRQEVENRNDVTIMEIEDRHKGFIVGARGRTLRGVEAAAKSLMFFAQIDNEPSNNLFILSTNHLRRRAAELMILSMIDSKHGVLGQAERPIVQVIREEEDKKQEHCILNLRVLKRLNGDTDPPGFEIDYMHLPPNCVQYLMGAGGSTKRKVAFASGCVLEFFRRSAFIFGAKHGRDLCKFMIEGMISLQRNRRSNDSRIITNSSVSVDLSPITDYATIVIPDGIAGIAAGRGGASFRAVERITETYIFLNPHGVSSHRGYRSENECKIAVFEGPRENRRSSMKFYDIIIVSNSPEKRARAVNRISTMLQKAQYAVTDFSEELKAQESQNVGKVEDISIERQDEEDMNVDAGE
eukprot:CAMPEP_0167746224 /NCGR_PEP_ID=MMETSP0110_2-20121227/3593_1 /TAXON_ID=629695 /ORGANISM="Gymnochlora sp., Strain CCMP2014" /LENGTH=537 /DNA_ID=CAMNT_0007630963 /DNA_START=174 /DNA_END=1783 /DNA_ORIENTATION=-